MFEKFVKQLMSELSGPLPGEEAQYLMAPAGRARTERSVKAIDEYRNSSVLVLLYPHEETIKTVLLKRHEYQGVHSGQVGFPGGKQDEADITLERTALREANEEIGLEEKDVTLLGPLTKLYIPVSRFMVQPYVAVTPSRPDFKPDPFEVNSLIEVSTDILLDKGTVAFDYIERGNGLKIRAPYYAVEGHIVWGATAMIISELTTILGKIRG